MQNPPELDFSKILDQTLYTYMPEKMAKQEEIQNNAHTYMPEHGKKPWPSTMKLGLVNRLRPMVVLIGLGEIIVGLILMIIVTLFGCEYNKLYDTMDSSLISLMSYCGLFILTVSGMMLLISLELDTKKVMWYSILMSTLLCVYFFVLSVMKIHFALLVLERDTYKVILPENRHFLLSTACVIGIATMLGSVIHFIGNVTVFTYYNLKYIQPIIFNCGP